jgi:hypothetical protein
MVYGNTGKDLAFLWSVHRAGCAKEILLSSMPSWKYGAVGIAGVAWPCLVIFFQQLNINWYFGIYSHS